MIGRELTLDYFAADARVEIDSVQELLIEDGGSSTVESSTVTSD